MIVEGVFPLFISVSATTANLTVVLVSQVASPPLTHDVRSIENTEHFWQETEHFHSQRSIMYDFIPALCFYSTYANLLTCVCTIQLLAIVCNCL